MKEDYLVLDNLIKEFGGAKDTVIAVDRVSLQVREGELVTLLGPSGCGKTTTLRMIAGFEFPSSGDIYLDGERILNCNPGIRGSVRTVTERLATVNNRIIKLNVTVIR